ncbi:MAG: hypothetical protein EOO88_00865 [Pedobacter sp.]|nr:MAG: hypothetical protein EOO88_00865 [Pedobacter sp.]
MKKAFFILLFLSAALGTHAAVSWDGKTLTFSNEWMSQSISFEKGKVSPVSIYCKRTSSELLASNASVPWFEFVINKQLVTASQPLWKYSSHKELKLGNGGTELVILIEGLKHLKGLQVEIRKQYFPNSTLTREKLYLTASGKQSFTLNKYHGGLHFIFPRYSFSTDSELSEVKETRIGTYGQEALPDFNAGLSPDQRHSVNNLAYCHMFTPDSARFTLNEGDKVTVKGPFQTLQLNKLTVFSAYEHASQDTRRGFQNKYQPASSDKFANDGDQGVSGVTELDESDSSLWFIGMETRKLQRKLDFSLKVLRGGYLENEKIDRAHPYETVWSAMAFFGPATNLRDITHHYLMEQITSHKQARTPRYYYNTWGMQRSTPDVRGIFTEARIKEEIGYAADLGADLFVMDDGWEVAQGVWTANSRLKSGITPLVEAIKKRGMIPGIWMSPMGIDPSSERFKAHPEWLILDKNGDYVKGQWNLPVFDMVGGFYDVFLDDCKRLVDQGIRFFKWDAINSFPSTLTGLAHGDASHSLQERKDRYDYLLPFYVTRAMRELREYNPDVVVEIDLTEPQRCMIGLMPLQEGKLFWMNNGGSGYNDYSSYRSKSMRTVVNRYDGILPSETLTFAVYPHNGSPFFAQRYNVNTAIVGGRGFWGNLQQMNVQQRKAVLSLVSKSKRVLPYITKTQTTMQGAIGASPEIYSRIDQESGYGQVIGFSGSAVNFPFEEAIDTKKALGVLNHAYSLSDAKLSLPFQFSMSDDTREAFILGNDHSGVSVLSSTGWLEDLQLGQHTLKITAGSDTEILMSIPSDYKEVQIDGKNVPISAGKFSFKIKAGKLIEVRWRPL